MRDKLDFGYRQEGQSVEIFEIRPVWNDPSEKMESSIAKATYVKSKNQWKVYWMRADLKWHGYEPCRIVKNLEEFLQVVDEDQYGQPLGSDFTFSGFSTRSKNVRSDPKRPRSKNVRSDPKRPHRAS